MNTALTTPPPQEPKIDVLLEYLKEIEPSVVPEPAAMSAAAFSNQPPPDPFTNQPTPDPFLNQPAPDPFTNQPRPDPFTNQPPLGG